MFHKDRRSFYLRQEAQMTVLALVFGAATAHP